MIMFFKKSILNEKELHQRGQALQKFNLKGEKVYILASATFVVTFFWWVMVVLPMLLDI